MSAADGVRRLPFDQYQRYRLVADLLGRLRGDGPPLAVLDVGGRTALLRRFLADDRITLVDPEPSEEAGLVLGSGGALPFRDGSFDVVCAFDTLEHVPPEGRDGFVRECARVARRWVALAGPYHAQRVAQAEELLQRFLFDKLGTRHRYLEEHRRHGLPDRESVENVLRELGGRVVSLGHANLERWLALMCLAMYLDDDPALRGLAGSVHEFYNERLYATDHAEPVYRHVVLAALDGAPLPDTDGLLPPAGAPAGALATFVELSSELFAFDRERDAWRAERERLRESIAVLREDLEQHEGSVRDLTRERDDLLAGNAALEGELERDRAEGAAERDTLRRDLEEHRRSLEESARVLAEAREDRAAVEGALRADLEAHRAEVAGLASELEAVREARAGEAADAEARLEEHRQVIAAVRAEVEAERAAREALEAELRRVVDDARRIEAALIQANEAAQGLNATLQEREAELAAAREELARRAVEVADLRAELRRRWGNLKRALSPRTPRF